ncbi:MAG: hypothetical protein KDJ37_09805 [Hyphomicrobiaceae bacterium]|nr:hypothetical protein [Hyphomicrobiaceae bacterium]
MMRIVVVVLAGLAGAKIWTQHAIHQTAMEDALIAAYRAKAVEACRHVAIPQIPAAPNAAARRVLADAWAHAGSPRVEIGDETVAVSIWQVDDAAWDLRFRHAYVVLEAGAPQPIARCSYDVKLGRAHVTGI